MNDTLVQSYGSVVLLNDEEEENIACGVVGPVSGKTLCSGRPDGEKSCLPRREGSRGGLKEVGLTRTDGKREERR